MIRPVHRESDGLVLLQYPNSRHQFCRKIPCGSPSHACYEVVGSVKIHGGSPSYPPHNSVGSMQIANNSPFYGPYKLVGGFKIPSHPPRREKFLARILGMDFILFGLRRNRIVLGMVHATKVLTVRRWMQQRYSLVSAICNAVLTRGVSSTR